MAVKRLTPAELDKLSEAEESAYWKSIRADIEDNGGGAMTDEELVASGAVDTTPEEDGQGTVITKTGK
jgi:hypothetical protein